MKNNHSTTIGNSSSLISNHPNKSFCKLPRSSDTTWFITHRQFIEYGRNAKEWMRKCALLLSQIEKQQIWRKKRFHNIYDYAAKLAGMSHDQVNEALRIVGKAENLPALKEVISLKGLNAVRPIIAIATEENQKFLAEKAMSMSNGTLRMFIKHYKNGGVITSQSSERWDIPSAQSANLQSLPLETKLEVSSFSQQSTTPLSSTGTYQSPGCFTSSKITLTMQLDPEIADEFQKIKGQGDWNEAIRTLLKLRQEKLEQGKPVTVGNKGPHRVPASRPIPAAISKYVVAKTNGTCAFPCCYKPYEILHHTDRFAMYHIHDPDKIFPLCEAHERLAHLGLIENENQTPKYWKLRAQPDYDDPKYEIDMIVEKYRQPAKRIGVS
jgi:hypothetical protein